MRIYSKDYAHSCSLFSGIPPKNVDKLMDIFHGRIEVFYKNETFGGNQGEICFIMTGKAYACQLDYWGNRSILINLAPGSMLVGMALPGFETTHVEAVASATVTALFIRREAEGTWRYSALQPDMEKYKTNFDTILAGMYLALLQKHYVAEQRTIRDKILAYLSPYALNSDGKEFTIDMTRQELADYLYVDRCALCHELSRMQDEGLLTYHRNRFHLSDVI